MDAHVKVESDTDTDAVQTASHTPELVKRLFVEKHEIQKFVDIMGGRAKRAFRNCLVAVAPTTEGGRAVLRRVTELVSTTQVEFCDGAVLDLAQLTVGDTLPSWDYLCAELESQVADFGYPMLRVHSAARAAQQLRRVRKCLALAEDFGGSDIRKIISKLLRVQPMNDADLFSCHSPPSPAVKRDDKIQHRTQAKKPRGDDAPKPFCALEMDYLSRLLSWMKISSPPVSLTDIMHFCPPPASILGVDGSNTAYFRSRPSLFDVSTSSDGYRVKVFEDAAEDFELRGDAALVQRLRFDTALMADAQSRMIAKEIEFCHRCVLYLIARDAAIEGVECTLSEIRKNCEVPSELLDVGGVPQHPLSYFRARPLLFAVGDSGQEPIVKLRSSALRDFMAERQTALVSRLVEDLTRETREYHSRACETLQYCDLAVPVSRVKQMCPLPQRLLSFAGCGAMEFYARHRFFYTTNRDPAKNITYVGLQPRALRMLWWRRICAATADDPQAGIDVARAANLAPPALALEVSKDVPGFLRRFFADDVEIFQDPRTRVTRCRAVG